VVDQFDTACNEGTCSIVVARSSILDVEKPHQPMRPRDVTSNRALHSSAYLQLCLEFIGFLPSKCPADWQIRFWNAALPFTFFGFCPQSQMERLFGLPQFRISF
jgi:hypothetical protein